jgi:hypothetical protein
VYYFPESIGPTVSTVPATRTWNASRSSAAPQRGEPVTDVPVSRSPWGVPSLPPRGVLDAAMEAVG